MNGLVLLSLLTALFNGSNEMQPTEIEPATVHSAQEPSSTEKRKSGLELVFVKGGNFTMGGDDDVDDGGAPELRIADECPHQVTVGDFFKGKYEVTQADWVEIMATANPGKLECDDCPVDQVSWIDVQQFIKNLNLKFSENYRLPTEEEWEFAAKGGSESQHFMYAGSNKVGEVAWYADNSAGKPHPVGMLKPNEIGVYDLSGNIWEWCSNSKIPYPCDSLGKRFDSKVLRGGTFGNRASSVRVRDRNGREQSMRLQTQVQESI